MEEWSTDKTQTFFTVWLSIFHMEQTTSNWTMAFDAHKTACMELLIHSTNDVL